MFDTNIVIVGNVLATPEWRRIESSGAMVANFRVASTARRFDRENNCWVDGNSLRVRVVAWRRLADGVASSVKVGDPVIVYGRLYTRDWKDEDGNPRLSYEMEAFSIGHDLARGKATFLRTKAAQDMAMLDDAAAAARIGGEPSVPVSPEEIPVGYGDGVPEELPELVGENTGEENPDEKGEQDDELEREVERLVAETPRRSRRARREPVAA